jgi:hypothetical protein
MGPRKSAADEKSSSWVVDLGSNAHETMSLAEICELYVRGTITLGTRIKPSDAGDWQELSRTPELTDALVARGISLLPRIDASHDHDSDSRVSEADFAAPTRQLQADQLWAAAGIKPGQKNRDRAEGIHDAETAMIDSRRMMEEAGLTKPSSSGSLPSLDARAEESIDDAETQLYQGGGVPIADPGMRPTPLSMLRNLNVPRVAILVAALVLTLMIALLVFIWR